MEHKLAVHVHTEEKRKEKRKGKEGKKDSTATPKYSLIPKTRMNFLRLTFSSNEPGAGVNCSCLCCLYRSLWCETVSSWRLVYIPSICRAEKGMHDKVAILSSSTSRNTACDSRVISSFRDRGPLVLGYARKILFEIRKLTRRQPVLFTHGY